MKTLLILGLLSAMGEYQVHGRAWIPLKKVTNDASVVRCDNRSATFAFEKSTQNGRDSYKIDFGKEIGDPIIKDGENEELAVVWKLQNEVVAEMSITPKQDDKFRTSDRVHITVHGPAHSSMFYVGDGQLFGGPVDDIYPSNEDIKVDMPSITNEGGRKGPNLANAVVERFWYTSGGLGIRVSEDTPLFVDQNKTMLILTAKNELPYPTSKPSVTSKIEVCLKSNVKQAWLCMNDKASTVRPPDVAVRKPTVTTWVYFERNISQEIILNFAKQMKNNQLDVGILGVDDGWETCYGSQIVNNIKFPDMQEMIKELHQMGMAVTFWVHPFVNMDCEASKRLEDHFVRYDDGTLVETKWWNGMHSRLLNFLNISTREFYADRLKKLQEDYGIDGFKFDAGEVSYIPDLNKRFQIDDPNEYTRSYVKMAARFGPIGEVRVGAGTFDQPIRQRLQDTNSSWNLTEHGLKSVIPAMLQLTVLGYQASIPDMVGGNAYGTKIDNEMLVRWTQLATFLPNMQFSYPPWLFGTDTVKLIKKYIDIHYKYSSYMMDLIDSEDLLPLVNPLWWIDPDNVEALTRDDEFLVGDQILVAPVVEKGAVQRDIYFPTGIWKDVETGKTYEGPKTVKHFSAPLEKLPWFTRVRFDEVQLVEDYNL